MADSVESRIVVDLDNALQRRAFRCPRGHADWEPTNNHFYCASCGRRWDVDPAFTLLVDDRDGRQYRRDEVTLVYADGSTYKEVEKGGA